MKQLFILTLFLLTLISVNAQKFERSAGIRLGYSNGIFFDIQNSDLSSYRFMLNWRDDGKQLTAMKFFRRFKVDKLPAFLSFYYGYGIHAGYSEWDQHITNSTHGYYWEKVKAPVVGLDGLIGVSYDLDRMPVSITCEAKPFFDFWGKTVFKTVPFDFAICAVYHF
jgi:hypothetical protein